MNNAEKKAWLMSYKRQSRRIDDMMRHIEDLYEQATRISAVLEPNESQRQAPSGDKMTRIVTAIMDEKEACELELLDAQHNKTEIVTAINRVGDDKMSFVLRSKYIQGRTWDEIAEDMSMSTRHIFRLHGEALNKLEIPTRQTNG